MAATCATNTVEMMGDFSGRASHSMTMATAMDGNSAATIGSSQYSSPALDGSTPEDPPFVFPAAPAPSALKPYPRAGGRRSKSVMDPPAQGFDLASGPSRASRKPMGLPDFSFNPGAKIESSEPRTSALPDFKFNPGANMDSVEPRSAPEPLPEFSFNPGATSESPSSMLSPPLSPRAIPNRGGHRRFGSEFVGGKIRAGESITVMSTSPTKSESGFASPSLAPTPAPAPSLAPSDAARRRGHSHKRSGAISSHDLSMILKPSSPNIPKGSSAPTSPSEFDNGPKPFPEVIVNSPSPAVSPVISQPSSIPEPNREPPQVPTSQAEPEDQKPTPRARVGFSDTLEFIPRPLSLVSTDTTSTATTRPGHSVSNSISSIISLSHAQPDRVAAIRGNAELRELTRSVTPSESRPSTAGAVLERTASTHVLDSETPSPRRRNSIPVLKVVLESPDDSEPLPSPTKTPKRWSFFGLDPFGGHSPPAKARPVSSSSLGAVSSMSGLEGHTRESADLTDLGAGEGKSSGKSLGKKKRQKRVKSWAGSILTRTTKSRARNKKSARRRSMTPPIPRSTMDDDMEDDSNDDEPDVTSAPSAPTITFSEPTKPERPRRGPEEDMSFPMIDLDAALGPFNTPSTLDASWEAAQRGGGHPKRQLHSAAGMRNFTGPGMHYHRRAESAPALPPFDAGRFGIPRFGSSSTMADVFEEDEEDDEESSRPPSEKSSEASEVRETRNNSIARSEDLETTPTREGDSSGAALTTCSTGDSSPGGSVKRKGSGSSLDLQPPGSRIRTEASTNSLHGSVIVEEDLGIGAERHPNDSVSFEPTSPSNLRAAAHKDLASLDVCPLDYAPSTATASPYSMSHASSFPSPRTPVSYDAQRISTAPSSIADEHNFQSLLLGEPGPEVVRMSVDVPSLTSTNSTMTRESMFAAVPRPRNMPFHEQRPASFTSTAFGRRRSSLASLSRLISSAHGERSKLSMEVPCEDEPEKKSRSSRSKRLSRMMQFWKTKEPKEC